MHGLACIPHEGVTLADLTEKKKGRFGWFSQSSDTHGKSRGFPPVGVGVCASVCCVGKFNTKKIMIINIQRDDIA